MPDTTGLLDLAERAVVALERIADSLDALRGSGTDAVDRIAEVRKTA